jgi:5-(carboxyamino)imidazole ribonucleotide synthase
VDPELPALARLGIVGAGQIARMTYQAALKLGITPRLLAERLDDAAALVASDVVVGHPDSVAGFAETCAVLTFEHERLDVGLLERLEEAGRVIRPGTRTIRAAFDKIHQRRVLTNRGFAVPAFAEITGPDDIFDFAGVFDWPIVLKTARAAEQDAKGVWIVENEEEALRVLNEQHRHRLLAETFVAIAKELVVLVARRPGGHLRVYPVTQVNNIDGVCRDIVAPAPIAPAVADQARRIARRIADELDTVGVLAVELFLTAEGALLVNELAARPHNAGHFTIEGTPTSQFENHIRAVLDLPLGPTWANSPAAATVNVISGIEHADPSAHLTEALAVEGAHVHLYGKRTGPGRKLGHVTALGSDIEEALELARRAESALLGRRPW